MLQVKDLAFAYWSTGLSEPLGFPTDIQFSGSTLYSVRLVRCG